MARKQRRDRRLDADLVHSRADRLFARPPPAVSQVGFTPVKPMERALTATLRSYRNHNLQGVIGLIGKIEGLAAPQQCPPRFPGD